MDEYGADSVGVPPARLDAMLAWFASPSLQALWDDMGTGVYWQDSSV